MEQNEWKDIPEIEKNGITIAQIPLITVLLVAANVVIWIVLELKGDTMDAEYMLRHGASYVPYVSNGEWYRLFTSMFLHFGAEHLMNNMLLLVVIGMRLEPALGRIRFLLLYGISGLCSSLLSYEMGRYLQDYGVSAGASGAVFGIIGGLMAVAIKMHGRVGGLSTKGILIVIAFGLLYGITTSGVDNWAHLGGVLAGFLFGLVIPLHRNAE